MSDPRKGPYRGREVTVLFDFDHGWIAEAADPDHGEVETFAGYPVEPGTWDWDAAGWEFRELGFHDVVARAKAEAARRRLPLVIYYRTGRIRRFRPWRSSDRRSDPAPPT